MPSNEFFLVLFRAFVWIIIGMGYVGAYIPIITHMVDGTLSPRWKVRAYIFLGVWVALGVAVLIASLAVYAPQEDTSSTPTPKDGTSDV